MMHKLSELLLAACAVSATLAQAQAPQCNDAALLSSPSDIAHRSVDEIIDVLGLVPSAEGGYYFETFRDDLVLPNSNNRSVSTAIYYLLEGPHVVSAWHKLDAAEVWHWYAGATLMLQLARDDGSPVRNVHMGPDLFNHQQPQAVIAKYEWQRAVSCGNWTLVGTTVAPAFVPEGYTQAPEGWEPLSS